MTAITLGTLLHLVGTLAGIAIAAWAAWRVNESPGHGEWLLKLAVWVVFALSTLWVFDRFTGNAWRWDFPLMLAAIAVYLWCGIWRHYRASRRRRARTGLTQIQP